ncbi:hypothetical protein Busp01_06500 [Trinickia caryophylli]|nr:hypothetical protein Busp01_06500 [Trinickia caryophylli]
MTQRQEDYAAAQKNEEAGSAGAPASRPKKAVTRMTHRPREPSDANNAAHTFIRQETSK